MVGTPPRVALFCRRPNRFVVEAEIEGITERAWLPNSARLTELLADGVEILVTPSADARRTTRWTVEGVRNQGVWVALGASAANDLLDEWLHQRGWLPVIGDVESWQREITRGSHRLDFLLRRRGGRDVLLEVKSLSIALDGRAVFSRTPSSRGVSHLDLLGRLALEGRVETACCFVVQRCDVDRLVVDEGADPAWVDAIRGAAAAGVKLLALRCQVAPGKVCVEAPIPVDLG